jgi:hypothetical protein
LAVVTGGQPVGGKPQHVPSSDVQANLFLTSMLQRRPAEHSATHLSAVAVGQGPLLLTAALKNTATDSFQYVTLSQPQTGLAV